jgi:hypothetical protein
MKNDVQDQLFQLKSEIAKERVARAALEKEVENYIKKYFMILNEILRSKI